MLMKDAEAILDGAAEALHDPVLHKHFRLRPGARSEVAEATYDMKNHILRLKTHALWVMEKTKDYPYEKKLKFIDLHDCYQVLNQSKGSRKEVVEPT